MEALVFLASLVDIGIFIGVLVILSQINDALRAINGRLTQVMPPLMEGDYIALEVAPPTCSIGRGFGKSLYP